MKSVRFYNVGVKKDWRSTAGMETSYGGGGGKGGKLSYKINTDYNEKSDNEISYDDSRSFDFSTSKDLSNFGQFCKVRDVNKIWK